LVDISPTRAVNTGALFTLPVFTGRGHRWKKRNREHG